VYVSVYGSVAVVLSIAFALIGTVQLVAPPFVREAYKRWDYLPSVRVVTGVLDLLAAVMLAVPSLRAWGIALAAILTFGSALVLLIHRHYVPAGLAVGLMVALIPATFAVPRSTELQIVQ
jgi:hypothetical protein